MPLIVGSPSRRGRSTSFRLPPPWNVGSADNFSVSIKDISLLNGETIALPLSGVTAVVGANNVGKTTFLKDVLGLISQSPGQDAIKGRLIEAVSLFRQGELEDLLVWLGGHYHFINKDGRAPGFVSPRYQDPFSFEALTRLWTPQCPADRLGRLASFLVDYSVPWDRLHATAHPQRREDSSQPPQHLLHYLEDDIDALCEFAELCEAHFRRKLTLDWLGGQVKLRIGTPAVDAPRVDSVTNEYRDALAKLPLLVDQGDGMKSFLGLLLPLISSAFPIVILDEPEAFLHPPQAAALGRELGRLSRDRGIQVVLATHDRNILSGLLESDVDMSVIKLDRVGDVSAVHQLNPEELRSVWSDTALRYSNILDGLFHRAVVLAEGDRDCHFYAAALEQADSTERLPFPPSDVLFIPTNGKAGMAKLARVLRAIDVPVIASPDLDILDDRSKIKTLVEAVAGEGSWASLESDYQAATQPFRQTRTPANCRDVLNAVSSVLDRTPDAAFSSEIEREVKANLRSYESPWKRIKNFGESAFKGQARPALVRLLASLEALGIVAVRVGELENFAEEIGVAKGPGWLPAALEAGAHSEDAAQTHIRSILTAVDAIEKSQ
jgi:ABC-type cobalamin/Fe3+-siderophores transport system ATPase subunit